MQIRIYPKINANRATNQPNAARLNEISFANLISYMLFIYIGNQPHTR